MAKSNNQNSFCKNQKIKSNIETRRRERVLKRNKKKKTDHPLNDNNSKKPNSLYVNAVLIRIMKSLKKISSCFQNVRP